MPFQQPSQRLTFVPTPGQQPPEQPDVAADAPLPREALQRLGLEAIGADILMRQTVDGPTFSRICLRHGWRSREFYALGGASWHLCPHCIVEQDDDRGRARYAELVKTLQG